MSVLGNQPPRSLETFGVIGILAHPCKIYYDTIFSNRHVGRVSDLLSARLKDLAPDELRFRIVLTFSLYEVYRCQLESLELKDGEPLPEPLVIECGVDDDKIAVGVSFTYSEKEPVDPGLAEKLASGKVATRFERLVAQMTADSDQVIVRLQQETRRVEIVSQLALPGKINIAPGAEVPKLKMVILRTDSKVSPLKGEYIELGDVDYKRLLEADNPGSRIKKIATGEFLAQGTAEHESKSRVKGQEELKSLVTRISGTTEHLKRDLEKFKVSDKTGEAASVFRVQNHTPTTEPVVETRISAPVQEKVVERVVESTPVVEAPQPIEPSGPVIEDPAPERESAPIPAPLEETNTGPQGPGFGTSVRKLIKSLFGRKQFDLTGAEETSVSGEFTDSLQGVQSESKGKLEDVVDPAANKILKDQVDHLEATISRMRKEAQAMKGDAANARAQKWADGMVGELLAEKARIHEMAKKLNLSARQKDLEHRNRESTLNEQLRRKDEQLRQKTFGLERAKEQLSQMSMTVERTKNHSQSASEEGQLRQKLSFAQRLLQGQKDENATLARRTDELKNQLMAAQSATAAKQRASGDLDLSALKTKADRLQKQNDEFKRANQLLLDKLNEFQKPRPGTMSNDELKKKLETAMRLAANYQKDSDQLRLKVEELQREEARLKGEVNRMTNALGATKKSGGQAA